MSIAANHPPANLTVGVLGQGRMGHGIALTAAAAGCAIRVYDVDPDTRRHAADRIEAGLSKHQRRNELSVIVCQSIEETMDGCAVLFEAVPEDIELKHGVLGAASRSNPATMICSNTSVIPITRLAEAVELPHRFVGTHWWNPADQIAIVEVVPGAKTSAEAVDEACRVLESLGKVPVRLSRDLPGFIGNRLQVALWREALHLLEEGICDEEVIDLVSRETFGRRLAAVGPCENMQLIGLELTESILGYLLPHLSDAKTPPASTRERLGALPAASDEARAATARRLTTYLDAGGQLAVDAASVRQ